MNQAARVLPGRARDGSRLRILAQAVAAGLATGLIAYVAIEATRGSGRIAAIWPGNAVILACLVSQPIRRWPLFLLCGLGADACANLLVGDRPLVAAGLAFSNGQEILLCAGGLWLLARPRLDLSRTSHLLALGGLALIASLSSALAAVAVLNLWSKSSFLPSLVVWTMSDALGLLIVTPALLALNRPALSVFLARPVAARNLLLLVLQAVVTGFVCLQPHLEFRYLIFGGLMLIAFKAEVAGAALGLLVTGALVVAMSALRLEPALSGAGARGEAFMAQLFLLAAAAIAFPVAGAIARRRELAIALEEKAREFQILADHASDLILRLGRNARIAYASASWRRLGYEPADLVGRPIGDLMHPDDFERNQAHFSRVLSDQRAQGEVFERRVKTASGEWMWFEGGPQVIWGADGAPQGMVTHLRDVTARKAAQAALVESEARYRMLADRATDIIVQTDACGVVVYASPALSRLGWAPEEIVGRPALDFIHEDDRAVTAERLQALAEGTPPRDYERREYRALRKDGGYLWLEDNSSLLDDGAGRPIGALSLLRDVTERRAFEDELEGRRAEAEAATIAKSEFLANMSHEIRTPLTGIMGFAGLLEEVPNLSPGARTYATRISTASRALLTVVNDILDFSKIEAGQVQLESRPFDPVEFVHETVELVSAQAHEKRLTLTIRPEGELPRAVLADAGRLRQVLLNLLGNAVKFTDQGEVTVRLSHAAEDGGRLCVSVTDTGIGIAPELLPRLFQRFSQADGSINRQYGGTGLGLAICKSLATLMGGEIGVESRPGQGARFWFTVAAPPCEPAAAPGVGVDEAAPETRPARILVVDDAPVNRELVGVLLSVFGHELTEAAGGAEAVRLAGAAPFDLILMDLQMPGMDGLTAAREIRARCPLNRETPIVALSANILPAHLTACREAGMDDHVGKPIDTRELLTKVAYWTADVVHPSARLTSEG